MTSSTGERTAIALILLLFVLTLIALYAPILIVVLGAFFLDRNGNFNFSAPTLAHFTTLSQNASVMDALRNTMVVGFCAVIVAVVLGLVIALYLHAKPRRGAGFLQFLVFLPFLLPPLVVGLSLLIYFRELGVPTGLHLVIIGHALFVLALVFRTIMNRLTQLGHAQIEASYDLGATPVQTFLRVIWPQVRGAVLIGAVLAFALSFDETLISLFLVGDQNTLPIRLWAMMRLGISPEVNAIALVVLIVSLLLVFFAASRMDRGDTPAP
jgi:putative spermidine/putrescine transport system permease protein